MRLPIVYSDQFVCSLPDGHRFPMSKFRRLYRIIEDEFPADSLRVQTPGEIPLNSIRDVHDETYVDAFIEGELEAAAIRRIGLPWSQDLVERTLIAVAGTIETLELARKYGIACNTAGGTHHAYPDRGSGFCILNDLAVAAHRATDSSGIETVLILDLDVHQGNGTAYFFRDEPRVHTVSYHCEDNFPFETETSDHDRDLTGGTDDDSYLSILKDELPTVLDRVQPDLVLYDAGVDVHRDDRLGHLGLTDNGLERRDRFVIETVRKRDVPIACVIGGGYDENIETLARRHAILHRQALASL